jgi:hypothetical protein
MEQQSNWFIDYLIQQNLRKRKEENGMDSLYSKEELKEKILDLNEELVDRGEPFGLLEEDKLWCYFTNHFHDKSWVMDRLRIRALIKRYNKIKKLEKFQKKICN